MSLAKLVLDSLKPQECKKLHLREPPPVLYVPEKDEVQKAISTIEGLHFKTSIDKDTNLNFPMWTVCRSKKTNVNAAKPMHYLCSRCKGCLIFMGV